MLTFLLRRVLALVPLLLLVSIAVFALLLLSPGDPASVIAGEDPSPERVAAIREELGLDRPAPARFADWVGGVVQGDLGSSLFTGYPVARSIVDRLPVTLCLVGLALALSTVGGLTAGVLGAARPRSRIARVVTLGSSLGVAVPVFWLALVLILVFSLKLAWLPATGYVGFAENPWQWFTHLALPAVALAAPGTAEIARQTRAAVSTALGRDFIRTARAAGLPRRQIVLRHALKNAMVPAVTVIALQVSQLFALAVIVEQIFDLPGVGTLVVDAVFRRDLPVIQGVVLVTACLVALANLAADLSYGWFDPRVRTA